MVMTYAPVRTRADMAREARENRGGMMERRSPAASPRPPSRSYTSFLCAGIGGISALRGGFIWNREEAALSSVCLFGGGLDGAPGHKRFAFVVHVRARVLQAVAFTFQGLERVDQRNVVGTGFVLHRVLGLCAGPGLQLIGVTLSKRTVRCSGLECAFHA